MAGSINLQCPCSPFPRPSSPQKIQSSPGSSFSAPVSTVRWGFHPPGFCYSDPPCNLILNGQFGMIHFKYRDRAALEHLNGSSWCDTVGQELFLAGIMNCLQADDPGFHPGLQIGDRQIGRSVGLGWLAHFSLRFREYLAVNHFTTLELAGSTSLNPHSGQQIMLQSGCTGHETHSECLSGANWCPQIAQVVSAFLIFPIRLPQEGA